MPRSANLFFLQLAIHAIFVSQGIVIAASPPTAAKALELRPLQPNVDYETVPESKIARCQVASVADPGWKGWLLKAGDGTVLRKFADTDNDNQLDHWCYFKNGVEVYRDIDSDKNGKADQYRWLGTEGSRWAVDTNEDKTPDRWRQISAQEVTAELVAALASRDAARFERLLLTPGELKQLGLDEKQATQIARRIQNARIEFLNFAKRQTSVTKDAKWLHFAGSTPGVLPAGTDGLKRDLLVYENAVAMFEAAGSQHQIVVGTLVQAGDVWRLIDLPQSVGDDAFVTESTGFFFAANTANRPRFTQPGTEDDRQKLITKLTDIEEKLKQENTPEVQSRLHDRQVDVLERIIQASSDSEQRTVWSRQLIDTICAAITDQSYPNGLKRMRQVKEDTLRNDPEMQAYAEFQMISTEYSTKLQASSDSEVAKTQEWHAKKLEQLIADYPTSREAARAMLQLALNDEFEGDSKGALAWYQRTAKEFPSVLAGKKAAGAIRRLRSVGNRLELAGTSLDGKKIRLSHWRGKIVLLHYWATWCEPCKQDFRVFTQLQARYKKDGLKLLGVNVDENHAVTTAQLKNLSPSWPQLYEPGGLETSRLALELGIQTLPAIFLIDKQGKVVGHKFHAAELEQQIVRLLKDRSGK